MQPNKKEQFLLFYEQFKSELSSYCRALMLNEDDAKDLMSDTVLLAFERFETIRDMQKFKYFLFGIASRLFRKKIRRKKIIAFVGLENADKKETKEKTDDRASLSLLYRSIAQLKEQEAEAIVLFELSGCTLQEVSEIMNINLNTAKTHVYRAKKHLEQILRSDKSLLDNALNLNVLNTKTALS